MNAKKYAKRLISDATESIEWLTLSELAEDLWPEASREDLEETWALIHSADIKINWSK